MMSQRLQAVIAHAEDLLCCPQPQPTKKQELRLGAHAPHSSAIRPLPSGKMMAGHREHSRRLKIHATLSFGYADAVPQTGELLCRVGWRYCGEEPCEAQMKEPRVR